MAVLLMTNNSILLPFVESKEYNEADRIVEILNQNISINQTNHHFSELINFNDDPPEPADV